MAISSRTLDTRRAQMFPTLERKEMDRLCRFGETRTWAQGEYLMKTGEVGPGVVVILSGEVEITQRDPFGHKQPIVTHVPGSFMGELAQLSGQPSLVDAQAKSPVEGLVIPSEKLGD